MQKNSIKIQRSSHTLSVELVILYIVTQINERHATKAIAHRSYVKVLTEKIGNKCNPSGYYHILIANHLFLDKSTPAVEKIADRDWMYIQSHRKIQK